MGDLFAGLDVSTQGCKLVVVDPDAGHPVYVARVDYDRDLPSYRTAGGIIQGLGPGVSESDPRMWIEAVERVLDAMASSGVAVVDIRCISVAGQQHGLVALASDGSLARPRCKLWNDFSTRVECDFLTESVGGAEAMIHEVGNTQRTGYTASKILHMKRHEPEAYARSAVLFLVHNFVNWYLTGGPRGGVAVMEPGDASGMALWHPGSARWSSRVVNAIDPDLSSKLPPVLPSDRTIGTVAPSLADRFGLPRDCRVDAGSGDNMYGAIGTGNVRPGIVTVSLGTSGTAYTLLEEPFIDPTGEVAAFRDSTGLHLPLVCVSNMANGYDALRQRLGISHAEFDDLVARTPPGNLGRVILPWFQGERTPDLPHAAPVFFGFGLDDFSPEALARAMVEGHVLNLHDGFLRLPAEPEEIRVTGGLSGSRAWCQTLADVFQAEAVPVVGEGAALGAALHAAWVWYREEGRPRALDELVEGLVLLDEEKRRRPDDRHVEANMVLRTLYRALSHNLRGDPDEDVFVLRERLLSLGRHARA